MNIVALVLAFYFGSERENTVLFIRGFTINPFNEKFCLIVENIYVLSYSVLNNFYHIVGFRRYDRFEW